MPDSHNDAAPKRGPGPAVTAADEAATDFTAKRGRTDDKIPRKFGRYRIDSCLGRGGMGAVFRAHDTQLDRTVALKVPFLGDDGDETRQRFYREARAAAALHHPNICPVFDVGEFQGFPYLTMAFIEGKSLAQVLKDGPQLSPAQTALLVRKLALAMQEAHTHGVIHRDLKPANVLMRNNEPIIMDFGLARRGDDKASEGLTRQGDVIGTLEYMSPEQLEGDNAAVGSRADIYSLGVVLYEVLTGRRPFTGTTVSMLTAILLKPPPRPTELRPGLPERLEEICMKAMARQPDERYATMADFAAALADFIRAPKQPASSPTAQAAEATPTPRPGSPSTRPIRGEAEPKEAAEKPAFEVVSTPAPEAPAPATASAKSRSKSASKRKKAKEKEKENEKKSKRTLLIGGIAAGIALLFIVGAIVVGSRDEPRVAKHDTTPPPAATPQPQPKAGTPQNATPGTPPKKENKDKDNSKTAAKSNNPPPKAPPPPAPMVLKTQPETANLPIGEPQEVTLDLQRNGYQGSVTVKWEGPPEVRITPAGPVTLKHGDPNPVLTVRLMSDPAGDPRLAVTATPASDSKRDPVSTQLAVRVAPGPCTRVIEVAQKAEAETMAFTPDASLGLVGGGTKSDDHAIRVWDLRSGKPLAPLTGHTGKVTTLVVSADGKTALSASADETVALWDLARGRRESQSPKQAQSMLRTAVSPDGKLALAVYPKMIVRVNLEKFLPAGPPIKTAQLIGSDRDDAVTAVALSEDRKALVGGAEGKLFLLDATDKTKPRPLVGHKEAVRFAAFALGGGGLAATGGGGVLQVGELRAGRENLVCAWDTTAGSLKWRAEGHTAPVVFVAFAPDGKLLASGGADGEVKVWDAADGKPLATFKGHTGRVLGIAFTPDGKALSSGAADGTIRQWRMP